MTVEKCIKDLASDFSKHYMNYRNEEDIRSKLTECLRGEFKRTIQGHDLVRSEFPVWFSTNKHFDIVILTENAASEYEKYYGHSIADSTRNFDSHAIFELKQKVEINYEEKKTWENIKRLKKAVKYKRTQNAYMLIFLHDGDIDACKEDKILKKYSKYTSECSNLDIYCIFSEQSKYICLKSGKITCIKVNT